MPTGKQATARVFEDVPAVRTATPLLVGLEGPSGGGKTFSALRLGTGFQRVVGGDIWGIDTEKNRMLHYADQFKFRHVPFDAPFSPLDYLAAIDHCVSKGAKTIIIDSMSHEHEGQGGVLEIHEAEVERLSKGDAGKAERVKMLAWSKPKQMRRRLINSLTQVNANLILCFRSKEKIKIVKGKSEPEQLGWMPIGGEEFIFEMTLCCLLPPRAEGVPVWESQFAGERAMMKLPGQFKNLFGQPKQIDEELGANLARWASGAALIAAPSVAEYEACQTLEQFDALEKRRSETWKSERNKPALKKASDEASKRLKPPPTPPQKDPLMDTTTAALNGATNIDSLIDEWDGVMAAFESARREIPESIQSLFKDRKAALEQ